MIKKISGAVQIPILVGLLVLAAALPIVSKLTQKNQDVRNLAAEGEVTATPTCNPNACSQTTGCTMNRCSPGDAIQTNCTLCAPIPTADPNYTAGCNNNCSNCAATDTPIPTNTPTNTPIPTNTLVPTMACTISQKLIDDGVTIKAYKVNTDKSVGGEVLFDQYTGKLGVDDSFNSNMVLFEVTISKKSGVKNVGLLFKSKDGTINASAWTSGSVTGTGLSFYSSPTTSGDLVAKFPLQLSFTKSVQVDISVQYY
jgi:hypothetical protein